MSADVTFACLKQDMNSAPFVMRRESVHGYYTETRNAVFKFVKRGTKYYVKVDLGTWPNEHEKEYTLFRRWLKGQCNAYGWTPYMTSGGVGKYVFRLNGDLLIDWD